MAFEVNANFKQMFSATLRPQGTRIVGAPFEGLEQQEQRKNIVKK